MKELDNKGINISGFQRFRLSKHRIQGLNVQVIQFSVWDFVYMYLWSNIVYLRFVFRYTTINGLERIRFMAQEQ